MLVQGRQRIVFDIGTDRKLKKKETCLSKADNLLKAFSMMRKKNTENNRFSAPRTFHLQEEQNRAIQIHSIEKGLVYHKPKFPHYRRILIAYVIAV